MHHYFAIIFVSSPPGKIPTSKPVAVAPDFLPKAAVLADDEKVGVVLSIRVSKHQCLLKQ